MATIQKNYFDQLPNRTPYELSVIGKLGPYALTHPDDRFKQYYSIIVNDPIFLTPSGNERFEALLKNLIYTDQKGRSTIRLEQYIMDTPKGYNDAVGDLQQDRMTNSHYVRVYGHEELKQFGWPEDNWHVFDSTSINNVSRLANQFFFDAEGQERYLKYGQQVRVVMNAQAYHGHDGQLHMIVGIQRFEISSLAHAIWY